MVKFRHISNTTIVILFALLHFIVAIVSRLLDYYDDIPLTILTILMVIVVAMANNTRVDIMAILAMVNTLLGFIIGSWLREPMAMLLHNTTIAPAVSTFIVTMVLGFCTDNITKRIKRFNQGDKNFSISPLHIVCTGLTILIIRMGYVVMDRAGIFTESMLFENILNITGNSWALLLLLAGNIALTMHIVRQQNRTGNHRRLSVLLVVLSTLLIPALSTLIIYYDIPHFNDPQSTTKEFIQILSAALLIDLIIITICYLTQMLIAASQRYQEVREQKHRSEYQYERLKQQINPHFLFNSLGILQYLVLEQETERATAFINKLASIYRYMLRNDQKPLIRLSEEIDFTHKYIDLLKERFTEGMVFELDIEEQYHDNYVVPCAVQLLVENATKHNIVSIESPLHISIRIEDEYLVVRNNLQPRSHGQPSTHLGLENIRQQYLDITGRDIIIEKCDNEFRVKLPIV
jgi:sensor histidine kinase YesM